MRHLMREHRGKLGGVVGKRNEPPRYIERAAGEREGVDRGRIEKGDAVLQLGLLGRGHQPIHGMGNQRFEFGRVIDTAVSADEPLVLLALFGG